MNGIDSGITTPATGLSSNMLRRSPSQETLATTVSAASSASYSYPGPPVNSPENQSVTGEMHTTLDERAVVERLQETAIGDITPPRSDAGDQTGNSNLTPTPTRIPTFEHSNWEAVAEEDVMRALKRLAMLANDLHAADPTKTIEQHYSERLSVLIKVGEVRFDTSYLQ